MIDLLGKYSAKYYLQLGKYKFSPIIKLTTGFALEYCDFIKESACSKEPFIFCFPEKKAAALWTSISILTNFYLEDYIDVELEGVKFSVGDKVEIFSCIAEVSKIIVDGDIYLKFRDGAEILIEKKRKSEISLSSPNRALNNYNRYIKCKTTAKNNRNAISKILEPKSDTLINPKNLSSKILLIAGRGQVNKFHDYLESVEIFGEKLGEVFPEGENLIITADLKKYSSYINSDYDLNKEEFIKTLVKASKAHKFEVLNEAIDRLLNIYYKEHKFTEEFDQIFNDATSEFIEDIPEIDIIIKKYPGIKDHINDDVRAVIINDITQLLDYSDTIRAFLEANIPVIVFSDRKVINNEDIDTYKKLFSQRPNAYRFNWNKNKIASLVSTSRDEDEINLMEHEVGLLSQLEAFPKDDVTLTNPLLIDQALWDQTMRYKDQTIYISTYAGSELDYLSTEILKHIKILDEFEVLQKSFYINFYTAIYALKNSSKMNESVLMLIKKFEVDFLSVRVHLPDNVAQDFAKAIEIAIAFEQNTKSIEYSEDIFSTVVPLEFDKSFTIPIASSFTNMPSNLTKRLIFTGYPYDEYRGKYLICSVCVNFVPEIEIKCWPNEASLTFNYLKRRIQSGYFFDVLPDGLKIDRSLMIKTDNDIETEILSYLLVDEVVNEELKVETDLEVVHQFKYKGFKSNIVDSTSWKVNCDVLNFDDGSFMFLAKGSRILCLSEDLKGKPSVIKKTADQFFIGDIIFRYIKDRGAYVEISKRDPAVCKSSKHLDYWRLVLQSLHTENNLSIQDLKKVLNKTKDKFNLKGNPTIQNLNRWLYDEELISPDEDNLRLILSTAYVQDIEEKLSNINHAYKITTAHRISLSTRIKKEISNKIVKERERNSNFKIKIDKEFIDVETRTISTVDTNGIIVDYHSTRKILC